MEDRSQVLAALSASAESWNHADLKGHLASYDPGAAAVTKNGPRPGVDGIESSFRTTYFKDGKPEQNLRVEQVMVRSLCPITRRS